MKNYSFVKDGEDHFVIHHKKDGEFKVAKKGLKKGLMDKISKLPKYMADGGEVDEDYPSETDKQEETIKEPTSFLSLGKEYIADPISKGVGSAFGAINEARKNVGLFESPQVQKPEVESPEIKKTAMEPLDLGQKEGEKATVPAPQEQQPAQAVPTAPDYMGAMGQSYGQIAGGIQKAAEAESKAQKQIADTIQENALIQQEQYNSMIENRKTLDAEHAKLTKDFMDQKIDPRSVWHKMGTGEKVTAALAMILSGIGSGLAGGPNLAMKVLEDAQNRDIEAQKAELGKKQNLLSMNLKKYGDLETAYNATRLQQNAMMTADLQRIAATTNSEVTKANAQKAIGMLNMDRDQKFAQIEQQMNLRDIESGKTKVLKSQYGQLPEHLQKKAVGVPGSERLYFTDEKSAEKAREATVAAQETEAAMKEAEDFQSKSGRVLNPFSDANKEAKRIQTKLQISLAKLYGVGRETSPEEKQKIYDSVPDIGSIRQQDLTNALNHIRQTSNAKLDSIYGQYLPSYKGPDIRKKETAPVLTQQPAAPTAQRASWQK